MMASRGTETEGRRVRCTVEIGGVNLNVGIVRVIGKGRKERLVPLGRSAMKAIESYIERGSYTNRQ